MALLRKRWLKSGLHANDIIWNTNCDILEEYYRQFGTCNCPKLSVCVLSNGQEIKIGRWLTNQRLFKKRGGVGGLTREREMRLQELVDEGKLLWQMIDENHWDVMYNLMVEYGQKYGHCNIPDQWEETLPDGKVVRLGNWVNYQRLTRDATMTPDHRKRLQILVDKGLFKWRTVRAYTFPQFLSTHPYPFCDTIFEIIYIVFVESTYA